MGFQSAIGSGSEADLAEDHHVKEGTLIQTQLSDLNSIFHKLRRSEKGPHNGVTDCMPKGVHVFLPSPFLIQVQRVFQS